MCSEDSKVFMNIKGENVAIDACIATLVHVLNKGGVPTKASCCGHGKLWGNIMLEDGRELIIAPNFEAGRAFDIIQVGC